MPCLHILFWWNMQQARLYGSNVLCIIICKTVYRMLFCEPLHSTVKTVAENWDSKAPSVGTILAYFHKTSQNFNSFSVFKKKIIYIFSIVCLMELKSCEVSRNSFSKQMLKISAFYLENQKILFLKMI